MASLDEVLESAASLQRIVPEAVLVGGTAAAVHARHRLSTDHDHVVADLASRFDVVLTNLEALGEWSTAKVIPGKLILGSLGGIETGVRQLRRSRPLEVEEHSVGEGTVRIPTLPEILRIKAWLVLTRNQTRDFLDVAALSERLGAREAAEVLAQIGQYYDDLYDTPDGIVSQLTRQLADPRPRDAATTAELASYKQLDARWHDWSEVVAQCGEIAQYLLDGP